MTMVRVDPDTAIPPFEQIRAQISAMVASGALPAGHRLPPIRQLAADLDVAAGTVARAYRALEAAGLVVTDGRRGTRVAEWRGVTVDDAGEHLEAAAQRFAATVRQLGLDPRVALRSIRRALDLERSTAS